MKEIFSKRIKLNLTRVYFTIVKNYYENKEMNKNEQWRI